MRHTAERYWQLKKGPGLMKSLLSQRVWVNAN